MNCGKVRKFALTTKTQRAQRQIVKPSCLCALCVFVVNTLPTSRVLEAGGPRMPTPVPGRSGAEAFEQIPVYRRESRGRSRRVRAYSQAVRCLPDGNILHSVHRACQCCREYPSTGLELRIPLPPRSRLPRLPLPKTGPASGSEPVIASRLHDSVRQPSDSAGWQLLPPLRCLPISIRAPGRHGSRESATGPAGGVLRKQRATDLLRPADDSTRRLRSDPRWVARAGVAALPIGK